MYPVGCSRKVQWRFVTFVLLIASVQRLRNRF